MKKTIFLMLASALLFPFAASASTPKVTPSVTAVSIQSNAASSTLAVPGSVITLNFTTNEKVTPIVLVNARPVFLKATNNGGNSWSASYTITAKDPLGVADYLLTLVSPSGVYACSNVKSPLQILVKYCPTTNGSSVTVVKTLPNNPPPDTIPPVIAAHANVSASAVNASGASVTYTTPTATDNIDGTDAVACTPISGSTFALGTTTVTCTAQDAAGNIASSTFNVIVTDTTPPVIAPMSDISVKAPLGSTGVPVTYTTPTATDNVDGTDAVSCTPASGSTFVIGTTTVTCTTQDVAGNTASSTFNVGVHLPMPITLASQPDQSFLCTPNWRTCYTGGGSQVLIPLGSGAQFVDDTLLDATIAKQDDISGDGEFDTAAQSWTLSIVCFLDAAYTQPCDQAFTSSQTTVSTDNIHWSAPFNFTFDSTKYYELAINDQGWSISAYGTPSEPYWVLSGVAQ